MTIADLALARLRDPRLVEDYLANSQKFPHTRTGLADGRPGLALLFASLSRANGELRADAHAWLRASASAPPDCAGRGLYSGVASIGIAAATAAVDERDYRRLLRSADSRVRDIVLGLVDTDLRRTDEQALGSPSELHDVISGTSGLGRYLLCRLLADDRNEKALRRVLTQLVALTRDVRVHGAVVPGWWTAEPVRGHEFTYGHFNLGMAHGIAGPLAMLSLALLREVRVAGHEEAVSRIASWLESRCLRDSHGPHWPGVVSHEEEVSGGLRERPATRNSWCYGTPGIARAVQLAGMALGEPRWQRLAVEAALAAARRPGSAEQLAGPGLCHGAAGWLHCTALITADSGDAELTELIPSLVDGVLAHADASRTFVFGGGSADPPGFLDGAAGAVLALWHVRHPASLEGEPQWDAALLLR
ncbi:lanthionine synthetase C family protein [Lentzea sp. NPDC004782]|uniref:lanthionine synthetase C family protein n=1 Tax=Lentzea sp. NPDC004782 TaxID=3154458 RepID=UPI0033B039B7